MTQPADPQPLTMEQILQILRNQAIATPNPSTSTRYLRAVESFSSSSSSSSSSPHFVDNAENDDNAENQMRASLADWLISQWLMNTPFTTASLYLDIISSLYGSAAKANLLPPTKLFSQLKTALKALGQEGWRQGIDDEIFARALRLTKNARHLIADDQTAAQLVIYSLTHNLLPLTQVALLKKGEVSEPSEYGTSTLRVRPNGESAISERAKRSRYWLPLRQSQRTPRQLQTHISEIVNALFRRARLPQATDPYQTVEALWAYAALRAGIPASTLVAHLGHAPLGLPVLRLSSLSTSSLLSSRIVENDENVENAENKEYFSQVGQIFLENPPRWYAMQLRPGVRFTQICRRIDQLRDCSLFPLPSSDLQLFYPSEEISRLIGKKIVTRQRPFIHSVVFFRAKLTDIGRLFSKIGDLAWCYRQSARPGAPYADISDKQFQLFQQTIARFTPDYEVAATGDLELREGDRVEILGGLFQGQQAIVEGIVNGREVSQLPMPSQSVDSMLRMRPNGEGSKDNSSLNNVVYRLNIVGDNGIDWRITVDPRLLKPEPPRT